MIIIIRKETVNDHRTVEELNREAFWNLHVPGCDEHYLSHILRTHRDFIPEMDYVAEVDNKVVGSIMYTKSFVTDESDNTVNTLTFGPLCVHPEFQRKGIGTALINYTRDIAIKNKAKAIIIHGYPHNYCRHGFKNSIDYGISNSDGKYPYGQLALELENGFFKGKRWKFFHSLAYNLNQEEAQEFDNQFPPKNKEYRVSQEEFSIAVRAYLE